MSIGFKIKELREGKNITQPDLAHELDISQSKLSKIENSRRSKEIDFLLMDKVCKYFDVDFEYFLEGKTVNNFKKVGSSNISCENATINNFPENIIENITKLIEDNKTKDAIIKDLQEKLKK